MSVYFGVYIGDFKDAEVWLQNNYLIRYEESVFGPMLQQMTSGKGFINLTGSKHFFLYNNIYTYTHMYIYIYIFIFILFRRRN